MFFAAAFIVFIVCSVILLLPKYKGCASGCLSELARLAALGIGSLSALIVLFNGGQSMSELFAWEGIVSLLRYVAMPVTLVLGTGALALVAHGWQTLAGRGNAVEDQADLTAFDTTTFLNTNTYNSSGDDELLGCLFAIIAAIIGGLFWLGLQLAVGIAKTLPSANTSREGRVLLSVLYGVGLFGLIVAGLLVIFR